MLCARVMDRVMNRRVWPVILVLVLLAGVMRFTQAIKELDALDLVSERIQSMYLLERVQPY